MTALHHRPSRCFHGFRNPPRRGGGGERRCGCPPWAGGMASRLNPPHGEQCQEQREFAWLRSRHFPLDRAKKNTCWLLQATTIGNDATPSVRPGLWVVSGLARQNIPVEPS